MDSTEFITIQKYAAKNRLSIHTVIKKTMNGELPTLVKVEDGKEITYILLNPTEEKRTKETADSASEDGEIDYKKEYEALHKEYLILKTKYGKLLEKQG